MPALLEIRTPRLRLRRWRREDLEPFAALNGDFRVMEHFPGLVEPAASHALVGRIDAHFREHGFGLWAVEVTGGAPFIGFAGLCYPSFEAAFTPCVEVGWRLCRDAWGHGYATEAATAALACGFGTLGLREILSFTVLANRRSWRIMEKLGMRRDPAGDFDHPRLPPGHPLERHVLYRVTGSMAGRSP